MVDLPGFQDLGYPVVFHIKELAEAKRITDDTVSIAGICQIQDPVDPGSL
jgi:hypothetical protein